MADICAGGDETSGSIKAWNFFELMGGIFSLFSYIERRRSRKK
jgi:hypothetical protein